MEPRHLSRTVILAPAVIVSVCTLTGGARAQAAGNDRPASSERLETISVRAPRLLGALEIDIEDASSRGGLEEVTVRAPRSLTAFRTALEAAEDEIFDIFNGINSSDDFDIRCRDEVRTGTRIPQRVCKPEYLDETTADSARAFLDAIFFGDGAQAGVSRAQLGLSRAHYMRGQLEEELRRVVREHPNLLEAMIEYVELEQAYRDARRERFGD